jgi:hypothetical protein
VCHGRHFGRLSEGLDRALPFSELKTAIPENVFAVLNLKVIYPSGNLSPYINCDMI